MKKINIIFWSGTGNTKLMAEAIAEGAKANGDEVKIIEVENATVNDVLNADVIALGCPSMGNEVLEDSEMEPFVEALENEDLTDKPFVLFGSYDWGDGQWMREWEDRMVGCGVNLIENGLIVQNTPDQEGLDKCHNIGQKLSRA